MKSAGIIGAGISGLSCARHLAEHGWQVRIFEKSRSLGGRCATRAWNGHIVDHGAQFFTAHSELFRAAMETLLGEAMLPLNGCIVDQHGSMVPSSSPRFYHAKGNNRIGKALLGSLELESETTASAPEQLPDGRWKLCDHPFDAIVFSAPWPQSAALLGMQPAEQCFSPCLTAFYAYDGDWLGNSQACYARSFKDQALAWSACENHKTGRIQAGQTVFVVQAGKDFSSEFFDQAPEVWSQSLRHLLEPAWNLPTARHVATFTHRWRYARCAEPVGLPELPPGLHLCGDAFSSSRVEDAWLSGRATAEKLLSSGA